jgi:hypothetical protein
MFILRPRSPYLKAFLVAASAACAWADGGSNPAPAQADSATVRAAIPDSAMIKRKAQQRAIFLIDLARRLGQASAVDTMGSLTAAEKDFVKQKFRELHP